MAIDFVPALYEAEIQRIMPTFGSLFANGLIFNDPAPVFAVGGDFYHSRYLKSIASLGDDNKRESTGTITAKALSYGEIKGVIVRRYDAIEQEDLDVVVSGVDGLKYITPQIASANTANIERRFAAILFGLFRYGGALNTTHSYDYAVLSGSNKMDEVAMINASLLFGSQSKKLTSVIMHSAQAGNLSRLGLTDFPQLIQGQQVADTGGMSAFLGRRIIIDDDLCAAVPAATATAVLSSDAVGSITVTDGSEGYSSAPTVTISGGGGSGATATANLTGGRVTSITVSAGGSSYETAPTVTIAAPATYPAYLVGARPFYLGYQKNMRMELVRDATQQNITNKLRWDLDFCPHVINTTYVDTVANPADSALKTAANWASRADNVSDIQVVRILTK